MKPTGQRLNFLDAGRSILMLCIVIVHAGAPYNAGQAWIIDGGDKSAWITGLTDFISIFDIEAFFLISGLLTAMSARRYGAAGMGRRRLVRLMVPLAATALLLNLPTDLYLHHAGVTAQPVLSAGYLLGGWLDHLWFLFDLILYTLIATLVLPLLAPVIPRTEWLMRRLRRAGGTKAVLLLIVAGFCMAQLCLVTGAHFIPALHRDLIGDSSPYIFLHHALFFSLGMLLSLVPALWRAFRTISPALYIGAMAMLAAAIWLRSASGVTAQLIENLASAFFAISLVQFFIAQFHRWLNSPSAAWRYLSGAAYSVYLLHHSIIILAALWLTRVALPAGIEFALLLAAGFGLSLLIHHTLIRRVPLLGFLFNGKVPDKGAGRPQAETRRPDAPEFEVLR